MIIWFSLAVASLIFNGRVNGSPGAMQERQQLQSFQTNFTQGPQVSLNATSVVHYTIATQQSIPALSVILCQTSQFNPTAAIDSTNAFEIVQLFSEICVNGPGQQSCSAPSTIDSDKEVTLTFDLAARSGFNSENLSNFFLCFGQGTPSTPICDSYSPLFDLMDSAVSRTSSAPSQVPSVFASSSLSITQTNPVLSVVTSAVSNEVSSATITAVSSISTSFLTTYAPPTGTTTIVPTATGSVAANGAPIALRLKKGLSIGALVGIIIGAIGALLVLALLALLCLCHRRHIRSNTFDSQASQPEQVLLTRPYNSGQPYRSVSESRDLVTEKNSPGILASILEIPLSRPVLPQTSRHSYDSLNASAPYSGPAAEPPRLKQQSPSPPPAAQNAQSHSLLSRESSDASGPLTRGISDASGPLSLRSTVPGEGEEFEEYHDIPIYGDARHTPTVYQSHPSLQAPFLSEEGMTEEEIARLEEEERRIDAAIAEAERRRQSS